MWYIMLLLLSAVPPAPIITVDDGPDYRSTPQILDVLKRHRTKATFFVMGCMLHDKRNKVLLKRIVAEGHSLGNHLYSHLSPCKPTIDLRGHFHNPLLLSGSLYEMRRTQKLVDTILGTRYPMRRWRAPFGHAWCIEKALKRRGYTHVPWHIADLGSNGKQMLNLVKRRRQATVLLFHKKYKQLDFVLSSLHLPVKQ